MSRSDAGRNDANFLGRWARRKSEAKADKQVATDPETPVTQPAAAVEPSVDVANISEVAPAEAAPIPSLESLDESSDYSRFMAQDIGHDLRRLALRKLFKAPVFGIRDGLDDYDEDFTTFEKLGNIITADMKFHKERLETKAAEEQEEQAQQLLAQNEGPDPETIHEDGSESASETEMSSDANDPAGATLTADSPDSPGLTGQQPIQPTLMVQALPSQRPQEQAPPVLAPPRQQLRLRIDARDDASNESPDQAQDH